MKQTLIIFFSILSEIIFAQTYNAIPFSKELAVWVNPKKDSIKAIKLQSINCYKIKGKKKTIDYQKKYNPSGYVLVDKRYSFKYDANNNITQIIFPDIKTKMNINLLDSLYIDSEVDTNKVFAALYLYNDIFYKKYRRYISKDGKGIDFPDTYYDTLNICNTKLIKYNSKSKSYFDCSITNLIFTGLHDKDKSYRESYKYDFSNQPPNIEYTLMDTLGNFNKTYNFFAIRPEDSPIFNYILYDIYTFKKENGFNEYIEEYYSSVDKVSNFPIYIIQTKEYPDKTEIYNYKGKSVKTKKLTSFYTLKTEYTYYK